MKEYHGPAIGCEPWQFSTACFVDDHIGAGDAEAWQQFLTQLQSRSAPVFVEYLACDLEGVSCLPLQTYYTAWTLDRCVPLRPWPIKTSAFNFSVNKRTPSRGWMVRCLDQLELVTLHYSKSWADSALHPCRVWLTENMIHTLGSIRNGRIGNVSIFESWLRHLVYEPTVISLITEPVWDQPAAFISEKTVFAIESGTMPIWCGGWGIADEMRELGFDVFDDIIDHGYQYLPDAQDRVQQAVELNQALLRDTDRALDTAQRVQSRLEHNRFRMRSSAWFYQLLDRSVNRPDVDKTLVMKLCVDLLLQRNYELVNSAAIRELR